MSPWISDSKYSIISIRFDCTYPLESNITIDISSNSFEGQSHLAFMKGLKNGGKYEVFRGASSPYIEFVSIYSQEDDNYIYKPFSTNLKRGDNGEFGKNLYQYLIELPNIGDGVSIQEIPQIQEINIITIYSDLYDGLYDILSFSAGSIIRTYHDGMILFDTTYALCEDGKVTTITATEPT